MERVIVYKGYRIEAKVYKVDGSRDQAHVGKWIAGQYAIGKYTGDAYTEKPVVHETRYCDTEEAIRLTWQLAREGIDRGGVSI